jgi:hypothetical protein
MAAHLTRNYFEGFSEVLYIQCNGWEMISCGRAVKRKGKLGVCVRKTEALTAKMETLTLISKGRYNLTHFVY